MLPEKSYITNLHKRSDHFSQLVLDLFHNWIFFLIPAQVSHFCQIQRDVTLRLSQLLFPPD